MISYEQFRFDKLYSTFDIFILQSSWILFIASVHDSQGIPVFTEIHEHTAGISW